MKVLEQARPNLPQKPAKSTKPAGKGTSKPDTLNAYDDNDIEAATVSKPPTAASSKAASKAGKPNSAVASAAGRKVQFLLCLPYIHSSGILCNTLINFVTFIQFIFKMMIMQLFCCCGLIHCCVALLVSDIVDGTVIDCMCVRVYCDSGSCRYCSSNHKEERPRRRRHVCTCEGVQRKRAKVSRREESEGAVGGCA